MITNLKIYKIPHLWRFFWLQLGNIQKVCNSEDVREQTEIFRCTVPLQRTFLDTMSAAKVSKLVPKDDIT
jgi:hypothetical protein